MSEEEGLKELDKEEVVADEEGPPKKEKRRARTAQPPPLKLLDSKPLAMAGEISTVEP